MKEGQDEQTKDSQGGHSGVDGAPTRLATDRGADRRLCRKGGAAPRASAQPQRRVSGA